MDSNSQTIHNLIGEFEMKYWDKFGEEDDNRYIKKNTRRDAFVVFGLAMITIFMIFAPPKWIIYAFVFSMIVGTIVKYIDK